MDRRSFVTATAAMFSAASINRTCHAAKIQGFANSKVAIGRGVYSEPKYPTREPHLSKVPGTMVSLAVDPPARTVFVTIFAQFRRNVDEWRDAQCFRRYEAYYSFQGRLRDIYTASAEGKRVTLFVPDATFILTPNIPIDIRFEIRFFLPDNTLLPELTQALPHETVTPPQRGGNLTVDFGRGNEAPPFEYYDLAKRPLIQLEVGEICRKTQVEQV